MPISALPVPPNLQTNTPVEFTQKTDNLLQALPTFVNEANALQTDVNAKQVASANSATASADSATASANSATASANSATASANSATAAAASATSAQNSKNAVLNVQANQALDVLNAVKTVDGSGSGLDADLLDGQQGSYYAPVQSPAFTGTPTASTAAAGTNTTQIATTAFVTAAAALKANLASPAFTGTPTAPTPTVGDNTTKLATTAFVKAKSEADSIGVGQTWQSFSSPTRQFAVNYTNATGKPIFVSVHGSGQPNNGAIRAFVGGIEVGREGFGAIESGVSLATLAFIVPDNVVYRVESFTGASLVLWTELR
jgi:hypothetical protein